MTTETSAPDRLTTAFEHLSNLDLDREAVREIHWMRTEIIRLRGRNQRAAETIAAVRDWANYMGDGRARHVRGALLAIIDLGWRGGS